MFEDDEANNYTTHIEEYIDEDFKAMFLDGSPKFDNLTDVTLRVMEYENNTMIQLSIINSRAKSCYRQYACSTHHNCPFRVSFGLTADKKAIVCKGNHLKHSGNLRKDNAKDGRKWKSRKKELLNVCYDLCLGTNGEVPKAKNVQAAAAKHYKVTVPYDSAYKACVNTTRIREVPDDASFQLIAPYLVEFGKVNPGSKVDIVYNEDKSIKSVFVCPGKSGLC